MRAAPPAARPARASSDIDADRNAHARDPARSGGQTATRPACPNCRCVAERAADGRAIVHDVAPGAVGHRARSATPLVTRSMNAAVGLQQFVVVAVVQPAESRYGITSFCRWPITVLARNCGPTGRSARCADGGATAAAARRSSARGCPARWRRRSDPSAAGAITFESVRASLARRRRMRSGGFRPGGSSSCGTYDRHGRTAADRRRAGGTRSGRVTATNSSA